MAHLILNSLSKKALAALPSDLMENLLLWTMLTACLSWTSAYLISMILPNSPATNRVPTPEPAPPDTASPAKKPGAQRNLDHLAPHVAKGGIYAGCNLEILDQYLMQEAARIKARERTKAYQQETEVMGIVGTDVWRQASQLVVYQRHCNGLDIASNRAAIEKDLETTPVFGNNDVQNLHANHRHMCHCFRMCQSVGWQDSQISVRFFYDLWLLRFRFQYDTIQKFASRPPPVASEVHKMRLLKGLVFGEGITRGEICWWYPRYVWTDPDGARLLIPNPSNIPHSKSNSSTAIASHWFQDWINEKDNLSGSKVFSPDSLLGFKLGCHFFASVKASGDIAAQRGWHGFLKELDSKGIDSMVKEYGISVFQEWNRDLAVV